MDTLTKKERSIRMSKIRSTNTKPEIIVRKTLHNIGLRFRINRKDLPGKPDISVKKYKLAIEVRGCFWHGHETCSDGHIPKTNSTFWKNKFDRNKERDRVNFQKLSDMGYKVFIIWECETRSEAKLKVILNEISHYLKSKYKLYFV